MRFLIVGTGGVGGYFGARLAKDGADVWFLARGEHYDAMHRNGLRIKSADEEFTILPGNIISRIEDAGKADVVFFCVKSYDTVDAAKQLEPVLHRDSIVISLQNGIDNEEKIQAIIPCGTVIGGIAYISSAITAPGEITRLGPSKQIIFGPLDGVITGIYREICDAASHAGIDAILSGNITVELWKKFIFLAPVAGFTAITRLTMGEIVAAEQPRALFYDSMKEIEIIARKRGINIPAGYVDETMEKILGRYAKTRSSLFFDLKNGKQLEIDALSGTVVRLGNELGVPTPVHQFIYSMLLPHHIAAKQRLGIYS
jgi:2-dehydropantoate 2-reductase